MTKRSRVTTLPMFSRSFDTSIGTVCTDWRSGDPTYLFIHGLGGSRVHFADAFEHPDSSERGLLSIDLLGFGASDRLADTHRYSFKLQSVAVSEALSQLGPGRVNLVLHSMAAGLLTELPHMIGTRLSRVFLLEGNLREDDATWSQTLSSMSDEEHRDYFARVQKTAPYVLARQLDRSHSKTRIRLWSNSFLEADERAMREMAIELFNVTRTGAIGEAVSRLKDRVVYVRGENRREWDGYGLLQQLGVDLVRIPNAGHYMMLDDPARVYEAIFNYASD